MELCPSCLEKGTEKNLKLYQINMTEAVYICDAEDCSYPTENKWKIIKRSYEEILDKNQVVLNKEDLMEDIEKWLSNIYTDSQENKFDDLDSILENDHNKTKEIESIVRSLVGGEKSEGSERFTCDSNYFGCDLNDTNDIFKFLDEI